MRTNSKILISFSSKSNQKVAKWLPQEQKWYVLNNESDSKPELVLSSQEFVDLITKKKIILPKVKSIDWGGY